MKSQELDKTDRIILSELQKNAQRPIAELAQKAGLSPSSCHRRVKLMEEAGVIQGYTANLDRARASKTAEVGVALPERGRRAGSYVACCHESR